MGPMEAFATAWKKAFTYGGRATRAEYWWFYLLNSIVGLVLGLGGFAYDGLVVLLVVYGIAQVFPSLSITIRRLRDAGKQWVWIFINFVPLIGGFWFLYLLVQPSVVA